MTDRAATVLLYCGIRPADAKPWLVKLAEEAQKKWEWLPHAATWLRARLKA